MLTWTHNLLYSLIEGTIQQALLDPEGYPLEQISARITASAVAAKGEKRSNSLLDGLGSVVVAKGECSKCRSHLKEQVT